MINPNSTQDMIETLQTANIIKKGHFLLTSGNHSDTYIQKDIIHHHPEAFFKITNWLNFLVGDYKYDYITGPALAGAIIARVIATDTHIPFVYPEKVIDYDKLNEMEPKMQLDIITKKEIPFKMKFRRGHDKFIKGKRGLIVEDIITTGGSVEETATAMKLNKSIVVGVVSIWNRGYWNFYPNSSIIKDKVEHFNPSDCQQCKDNIPLQDPKNEY